MVWDFLQFLPPKQAQEAEKVFLTFEKELHHQLAPALENSGQLGEAIGYSLEGGKRVRPLLLLMALFYTGTPLKKGLIPAISLELIHSYSLIHDDLPCMDNDDYRRGKLTVHKKFGEDCALLAGDAQLTLAFDLLFHSKIPSKILIKILQIIGNAAGLDGMIGGQWNETTQKPPFPIQERLKIYSKKTGALIKGALLIAGLLSNLPDPQLKTLSKIGDHIGLIFQLTDDRLDLSQDSRGKEGKAAPPLSKKSLEKLLSSEKVGCQTEILKGPIPLQNFFTCLLKSLLNRTG